MGISFYISLYFFVLLLVYYFIIYYLIIIIKVICWFNIIRLVYKNSTQFMSKTFLPSIIILSFKSFLTISKGISLIWFHSVTITIIVLYNSLQYSIFSFNSPIRYFVSSNEIGSYILILSCLNGVPNIVIFLIG